MRRFGARSGAKQREEILRELVADDAVFAMPGKGHSRAVEAHDALRRIRDGTYGICTVCDGRIPPARLRVKPEATRCVTCQTGFERRSAACTGDWNHVVARSA